MAAPNTTIRAATRDDADGITDVQVASWRAGYAHVFPDTILYADDFDATRRTFWNDVAIRSGPPHRGGDGRRSTAASRWSGSRRTDPSASGPVATPAVARCGRSTCTPTSGVPGVAVALMEHVETRLLAEGFDTAVLWVLDDNPRARRFYERHGWAASGIGANFDDYCDVQVPEVEYRKTLSGVPGART